MAKTDEFAVRHFHKCGKENRYNKHFDAYFCQKCDVWLELQCGDEFCEFCKDRPKKPSETDK